mmetsp:Transcript_51687/g.59077  ORF Transcript_51687/g.59077 Transcript_51687/m.59077 type:complete len:238 (-) Transcript_51687:66-779(-)
MELLEKRPEQRYQLLGDNKDVVQFVLLPDEKIFVQHASLVYCGSGVEVKRRRGVCSSLFSQIGRNLHLAEVCNVSKGVSYVGVSQGNSGKLMVMNPLVTKPIMCKASSVLAYTPGVKIEKKHHWYRISGSGLLVLQTEGSVIEKRLATDEEIHVRKDFLLAYSESAKIEKFVRNPTYTALLFGYVMAKINGPGVVYFSNNRKPHRDNSMSIYLPLWMLIIIMLMLELIQWFRILNGL